LRADAADPPAPIAIGEQHGLLDARELARIAPTPQRPSDEAAVAPAADGGKGLRVENRGPARVCIIVQGVPIGFVEAEGTGVFEALAPGVYRVAALRGTGLLLPPALVRVPGELQVGRAPLSDPAPQLGEPPPDSPEAAR
jgi:hypothetical protein